MKGRSEKDRPLSESEQRRLDAFEDTAAAMVAQGYMRVDLLVSVVKANIVAIAVAFPVFIGGIFLFVSVNGGISADASSIEFLLTLAVAVVVLICVHEGVHGLTWAMFSEHHLKDIEFGFMKKYFTPYCCCTAPLARGPYVLGALMPLVLVGIVPTAAAIAAGSYIWLMIGLVMTLSATGDVMIAVKALAFNSGGRETVFLDHPTLAGVVAFVR